MNENKLTLDERIKNGVNTAFFKADHIWEKVGHEFITESQRIMFSNDLVKAQVHSNLPDLPFLEDGRPIVANYIALVLDIRESTKHLTQSVSADITLLRRVVTETFAINAMGAIIVTNYNGSITEYLGDGFLAFFKVDDETNVEERGKVASKAYYCAEKCIEKLNSIVNVLLKEKYKLPALEIGIGLAYSKAIVSVVGGASNFQVKAIGECVFNASKLAYGKNEIHTDKVYKRIFPKAKNGEKGTIEFKESKQIDKDFPSFKIEKK